MNVAAVLKRGVLKGLGTTWQLAKVIVPIYFFVTLLKYIGALPKIAEICTPFMNLVGLPGEASIAIVLGNFVNIYAAIGAITPLGLHSKEITIIAMMLLLSHTIFVESAVSEQTGISGVVMGILRLVMSFLIGYFLNILM